MSIFSYQETLHWEWIATMGDIPIGRRSHSAGTEYSWRLMAGQLIYMFTTWNPTVQ